MESFQAIEKINSIQDLNATHFEDGTINLHDVLEEVTYLKSQIAHLRQELSNFVTGLASIAPEAGPTRVFEQNIQRATTLQKSLEDYVSRYKKLTPLLELTQRHLAINVPQRQSPSIKPSQVITNSAAAAAKKPRKRSYTKKKKDDSAMNTPNMPFMPQTTIKENDGSENQPILL